MGIPREERKRARLEDIKKLVAWAQTIRTPHEQVPAHEKASGCQTWLSPTIGASSSSNVPALGDDPLVRHFTLEEARRIINAAHEPFRTFFWIIAETGIRLGEACALRPCDFQLDLQVVVIQRSAWRAVHVGSTKTKRARIFSLSPYLAAHLRTFMAARGEDAFLFQRKDGTAWQGDHVVRNQLKPLLKQFGIKAAGAHAFRHLNASLMDQLRTPDKVRQERLGHLNFNDVTLNLYTHAESNDHRAVAEQLGRLLAPTSLAELPINSRTM